MLVAGMRAGERRAEANYAQQQQAQQAQQQAYQQGQQAAQAQEPQKDTIAELKKLGDLHMSGVLTDEEFAAAKKKLLA
jgi:membrane protease subunit (stomatin/prohibitin family)